MEIVEVKGTNAGASPDFSDTLRIPERFSVINRMILRDLNNNTQSPSFYLYTKDQISNYLKDP